MPLSPAAASAGFLLLLISLAAATTSPGPHIADLNVLLPPLISSPVGYRLQGSDGCFSWSWDHHDILSVRPEYNSSSRCSTSARLISIAPYSRRKETAVYATDQQTGITIRCKVFIDTISRIQIFHHSVKIDLDELASLQIRAFDDQENVFSSLVGLKFRWQLEPKSSESTAMHHLIHVPLKETPLSDCGGFCGDLDTQIALEDRGFGSDLYVVRGIEIGHEVVTAQLLEPNLEHVMDKIILTVAEAMSLDPPSPVFVTVGALIYYTLRVIRLNTPRVIDLPSPYHRWSAANSTVVQVDSAMGIAHALNLGITNIIVEDTRLSGHIQTSCIHVVIPDKLVLYMIPVSGASDLFEGKKQVPSAIWYVFPGQEYIIHMRVFSKGPDSNEIYIAEVNELKLESSTTKYWDISSVTDEVFVTCDKRKSRLLKPLSEGQGSLTASLVYYDGNKERTGILKVAQDIIVCSKVKLRVNEQDYLTQIIRLPWVPGVHQEVELRAIGGCGRILEDYIWFSSDEAVASVSSSGTLRAENPGQAVIKVVSIFDSINYDEVVVEISIPSSMIMLPNFPVETVIGSELQAAVTLKTSDGDYYCRCDAFDPFVRWKVFSGNETFRFLNTTTKKSFSSMFSLSEGSDTLHVPSCAWTQLYASAAGRAMLQATLSAELPLSARFKYGPILLNAISSLAAYSPLVIRQAASGNEFGGYWTDLAKVHTDIHEADPTSLNELYLAPGSSMDVLLLGGPGRWDQTIEYVEKSEVMTLHDHSTTGSLLVQQDYSNGGRLYRVFCQAVGDFKLLFSRGNLAGEGHPLPAIAYANLLVVCSVPSSVTLIANEPANTPAVITAATKAERTPGRIRTAPVTVANGRIIRMAVVGIHASGRAFANSSSLCLRWDLNGCDELAHWNDNVSCENSLETGWERFLVLHNSSGLCTVRATVCGFSKAAFSHVHAKELLGTEEDIVTDAIRLQLVSALRIIPESVLLVFDLEAKANFSVTGGTCFLNAMVNDTQVVQLSQPLGSEECSHLELSPRGLGTALVTVWDIGLSPPVSASALVRVANVDWVKIVSDEEISLMEGKSKVFDVLAGTHDGFVFDYSQYKYMNMRVHIDDDILKLVSTNDSSGRGLMITEPHFTVKAVTLGLTNLYVTVRQPSGHEIPSQMIKVEVYRQLRLHPHYVYLAPGASYVLTVEGGPKHGAFVQYVSMDEEIAAVHGSSGRVSAISTGNATIRASVSGSGGILISEAYARIQVGVPSTMILNLQSDRLCTGCKMPIFPSFNEGNLFSFYERCSGYKWAVEDDKVLTFQTSSSLSAVTEATSFSCAAGTTDLCHLDDSHGGFINTVFGRSAGRTKISVSFSCAFVSSNISNRVSYSASETLTVVADPPLALGIPITWILPPFYTSSDLLPGATDPYAQLHSRGRKSSVTYSVLKACGRDENDAMIIAGSKISTSESGELACIQAKDHITGRMEIASCVRVSEVAQVRVSSTKSVFHVAYLPRHAKVELVINYCDDLGYPFTEAHGVVPFDVETNYPDIVSIQRPDGENKTDGGYGKIILEARSPGRALVMVTIKQKPEKTDLMMVSVGAQIHPPSPVIPVGRKLNFTVIGDDLHRAGSGRWTSSNGSVLAVHKITGEAHAHCEGSTQVIFKDSASELQTIVIVRKADQILVESPAELLTNIQFPAEGYKFPIKFSDQVGTFEDSAKAVKVLYDCRVDPPFVGYAKSWGDPSTGNSFCLFFPYPPKHLLSFQSSATRSQDIDRNDGSMYISVIASLREAPQVEGVAHAYFVGGFSVDGAGKLNLTANSNKSLMRVIGNTDVEIHWTSKDLLLVTPFRTVGLGIKGIREYLVEVLTDQKFTDKLTIVLPVTGQQAEIDVNFEPQERTKVEAAGTSGPTWGAIGMCVGVLVATVFIFMKLLDRQRRRPNTQSTVTVGSPMGRRVYSPASPVTAAASVESSPRTPSQPFVEYVRRTVDETPYYKRNGRRRFDPQYTY